jgi:hypothetical protein
MLNERRKGVGHQEKGLEKEDKKWVKGENCMF